MRFSSFVLGLLMFCPVAMAAPNRTSHPTLPQNRDYSDTLEQLLSVPEEDIDLTWSKLVIDNLVDPETDIETTRFEVKKISSEALMLAGPTASDQQKVEALRKVIYEAGEWNQYHPFSYDFDNPNGRLAKNKTIAEYLETRRGNCVNMPIMFLLTGQEMGLELNLTTAPRHAFIQFLDRDSEKLIHLEPTSGALPQRIYWQRKVLPMTDRSIESGMYMKRLSRREQVAAMAETLLQSLREESDFEEMLEVTALILETFPENDIALLNAANASKQLIRTRILPVFQNRNSMPPAVLAKFEAWAITHDASLARLDYLGWQPAQDTPQTYVPK